MAIPTVREDDWQAKRIYISHTPKWAVAKPETGDIWRQIMLAVKEPQKGPTISAIAQKHGLGAGLVEQIARLYVIHLGVAVNCILSKMRP